MNPSDSHKPDQGPHSSENATHKNDLGFDPDSPDLEDPQVDPQGPAKPPRDDEKKARAQRAARRPLAHYWSTFLASSTPADDSLIG